MLTNDDCLRSCGNCLFHVGELNNQLFEREPSSIIVQLPRTITSYYLRKIVDIFFILYMKSRDFSIHLTYYIYF